MVSTLMTIRYSSVLIVFYRGKSLDKRKKRKIMNIGQALFKKALFLGSYTLNEEALRIRR